MTVLSSPSARRNKPKYNSGVCKCSSDRYDLMRCEYIFLICFIGRLWQEVLKAAFRVPAYQGVFRCELFACQNYCSGGGDCGCNVCLLLWKGPSSSGTMLRFCSGPVVSVCQGHVVAVLNFDVLEENHAHSLLQKQHGLLRCTLFLFVRHAMPSWSSRVLLATTAANGASSFLFLGPVPLEDVARKGDISGAVCALT